ncbi:MULTISPECIES: ATP-binding protein [unclassified Halomonas]|uniref:ATP-binding protein n=1 Tax=unclassified Halomonas TaxID=2609666 RepID=UPI0009905FDB|nr:MULTISPECIES: acylphosphatase [unclassified Halomonas]AQU81874.1 hypothetical protein B2G49_04230 [Halomonas sp. 'Soap Lake \
MDIKVIAVSSGGLRNPVNGGIWNNADFRGAANGWLSFVVDTPNGQKKATVEFLMPSQSGLGFPARAQTLLHAVLKSLVGDHCINDSVEKFVNRVASNALAGTNLWRKKDEGGTPILDKFLGLYRGKIVAVVAAAVNYLLERSQPEGTVKADIYTYESFEWSSSYCAEILDNVLFYWKIPEPIMPDMLGKSPQYYSDCDLAKPLGINGTKGHLIERHALSYGMNSLRFTKGSYVIYDKDNKKVPFKWSRSVVSSSMSHALTSHKEATRACLQRVGLPVPEGRLFKKADLGLAEEYANLIGFPVVCKPVAGVGGIGVFANLQTPQQLKEALEISQSSQLGKQDVIIEKHVKGEDYRILVLDGEVIAAIMRLPACVVGDGESTIAELIMLKNQLRRKNPHLWRRPIKLNDSMRFQLDRLGYSLDSIPLKDELVRLSASSNISQGGDSISVFDELHEEIKEACIESVRAIPGLNYCGVDFLLEDHTKPLSAQDAGICELNAHAAIGNCEYPLFGEPRDVAKYFLLSAAKQQGLTFLSSPLEKLHVHSIVKGSLAGTGYVEWAIEKAKNFGLSGWITEKDSRTIEVRLYGDSLPVSYLVSALIIGPPEAKPTSVKTEQHNGVEPLGFEIRDIVE